MKYFKILLLLSSFTAMSMAKEIEFRECEKWWPDHCVGKKMSADYFALWMGDEYAVSRMVMRQHVTQKKYESILDIPCGGCIDLKGFRQEGNFIRYHGIDITPKLIERAKSLNISSEVARIQDIPLADSSFDVTYSRHILEHLPHYEDAIKELVRVAKKEAIIIFFLRPTSSPENAIRVENIDGFPVYHNWYSKSKIETYLKSLPKISSFEWQEIDSQFSMDGKEAILHLYLK